MASLVHQEFQQGLREANLASFKVGDIADLDDDGKSRRTGTHLSLSLSHQES